MIYFHKILKIYFQKIKFQKKFFHENFKQFFQKSTKRMTKLLQVNLKFSSEKTSFRKANAFFSYIIYPYL